MAGRAQERLLEGVPWGSPCFGSLPLWNHPAIMSSLGITRATHVKTTKPTTTSFLPQKHEPTWRVRQSRGWLQDPGTHLLLSGPLWNPGRPLSLTMNSDSIPCQSAVLHVAKLGRWKNNMPVHSIDTVTTGIWGVSQTVLPTKNIGKGSNYTDATKQPSPRSAKVESGPSGLWPLRCPSTASLFPKVRDHLALEWHELSPKKFLMHEMASFPWCNTAFFNTCIRAYYSHPEYNMQLWGGAATSEIGISYVNLALRRLRQEDGEYRLAWAIQQRPCLFVVVVETGPQYVALAGLKL